MGFACFLMLQLLSTGFASWILLVATSPAAVALVNNPGKVQGFIFTHTQIYGATLLLLMLVGLTSGLRVPFWSLVA